MKLKLGTGVALMALALAGCATTAGDGARSGAAARSDVALVGGAEMFPSRTIVANAVNSPIHTTLVGAVKAAGLVDTLNSPGPFTVFAPTDAAFAKVPRATVDTLMAPAGKPMLTKVLTYHVLAGAVDAADLRARIAAGNGTATLTTLAGETLMVHESNGRVMLMGKNGSTAYVTQADVRQSNGVIHVIDGVLTPTL